MEFEWDESKNQRNVEKHGIDFKAAAGIFYGDFIPKKSSYSEEERWLATGSIQGVRVTVVYTIRNDKVRIISARRARKNE